MTVPELSVNVPFSTSKTALPLLFVTNRVPPATVTVPVALQSEVPISNNLFTLFVPPATVSVPCEPANAPSSREPASIKPLEIVKVPCPAAPSSIILLVTMSVPVLSQISPSSKTDTVTPEPSTSKVELVIEIDAPELMVRVSRISSGVEPVLTRSRKFFWVLSGADRKRLLMVNDESARLTVLESMVMIFPETEPLVMVRMDWLRDGRPSDQFPAVSHLPLERLIQLFVVRAASA